MVTPNIPVTMRAAAIDRFGPPAVLTPHTLPVPKVGPRDVLIAVYAAGVGVWDASIRDGSWRPTGRPKFPLVPGIDGAGIVVSRGSRARRFRLGERVYAYDYANRQNGFYAEYVAVSVELAARVPRRLNLLGAGAAATTGLTALQGIDDVLRVRRHDTVLIFGASGAVGTIPVQFAKRHKARVLATASGRAAASLVRSLGADAVIDARRSDSLDRLRTLAPNGIDAALVLAGGKSAEECLRFVRAHGRVAHPNGVEPAPRHRRNIRVRAYDAEAGPKQFAQLERAILEAKLRVPIAAVCSLARAAAAHARLERGHVLGKIVLQVRRKT
jgi:NADPH2:quinone reductase